MGLEQALTYGLLGMVGGGAKVVQEQEKADRENAAKRADEDASNERRLSGEQARSEREMAIEERKLRLAGQIKREQLPDRLKEIEAEAKARERGQRAGAGTNAALMKEARDVKRDEAYATLQELMQTPPEQRDDSWNKQKSATEKQFLTFGGSRDALYGKRQVVTENDPMTGEPKTKEVMSDGLYAGSAQAAPPPQVKRAGPIDWSKY